MRKTLHGIVGAGLLCAGLAQAGTFKFDFNQDPAISSLLTIAGNGAWTSFGGVGAATNAEDGFLVVTSAGGQGTRIIFSDFDEGSVVQGFSFECDLRIGNGSQDPADGFSVNYCRASDPVLTGGAFATGQNCEGNLPEEGTQTGIAIGFDAWNSGGTAGALCDVADQSIGTDVMAVTVRVDGTLVLQQPCPTKNGTCTDATSIQTGAYDGSGSADGLCWAHLKVQMTTDAKLSVWWKGVQLLNNYQTVYFPSAGRLVFAGRTGGSWQNQQVDNITITTIAATMAQVGNASGYPDGFTVAVSDSGPSIVDGATVKAKLDGVSVSGLTITKVGATTTVTYHGFPTLLVPGSSHTLALELKDTNGNLVAVDRPFSVGNYALIPAADAVTGVNLATTGFRVKPWQSGSQPNRNYWTEEQLLGMHGENNADLTLATDGGYVDVPGVLNYNVTPLANGGGDAGNFQTAGGYSDSLFPGIPGANGLNGSSAIEVLTFLKFESAGLYTMCVNSDDGFVVTEGKNPKDRFAVKLGEYDGGKGSSDVTFTVVVASPGIYPVRLVWENGNGEAGNGANMEWLTIKDGVKYLVNDPSATNASGITAYQAGPQLPAYVSHLYPRAGATGARADKLVAQITDAGTSLNNQTAQLLVDGVAVTSGVSKAGSTTTVAAHLTAANLLQPGTRTATLTWSDSSGAARSNSWSFIVGNYTTLNAGLSVPLSAADRTAPGFTLQVAQVDPDLVRPGAGDGMNNQLDAANALLGGCYFPWYGTNTVDLSDSWGTPPAYSNVWYWNNPIDFAIDGSEGDFTYNQALPGIPGVTGRKANFALWLKGYAAFTNAGYYRMSISSDDGFRISEGTGITRQVLHVSGAAVNRDVAAVVAWTGNTSFGAHLPVVPITAPVVYFPNNNKCPMDPTNLVGKIAAINNTTCADRAYVAWAQDNGAIGVVLINDAQWGMPYLLGGGTPATPITIPVVCVSGFGGEEQMWANNPDLVASIGADAQLEIGLDDRGKGMSWTDFSFVVPAPGLYPLHVLYEQGGGGAGLEWSCVYSDTLTSDDIRRVIVNDPTIAGSITSYRAVTVKPTPTISIARDAGGLKITYTGTLLASATVNGTYQAVAGASSPYTVPTGTAVRMFYRSSN